MLTNAKIWSFNIDGVVYLQVNVTEKQSGKRHFVKFVLKSLTFTPLQVSQDISDELYGGIVEAANAWLIESPEFGVSFTASYL